MSLRNEEVRFAAVRKVSCLVSAARDCASSSWYRSISASVLENLPRFWHRDIFASALRRYGVGRQQKPVHKHSVGDNKTSTKRRRRL
eukprot:1483750-Rhodomonas_salina.4